MTEPRRQDQRPGAGILLSALRPALCLFLLAFVLGVPLLASAASQENLSLPFWGAGGLLSCSGSPGGALPQCTSICDAFSTAQRMLYFAITIGLFAIAPAFVLVGAFQMIVSGGSAERFTQGRKTVTSVVVAALFVMLSFLIINTFFWLGSKFFVDSSKLPQGGASISPGSWSTIRCTPPAGSTQTTVDTSNPPGQPHQQFTCKSPDGKTFGCYANSSRCFNECAGQGKGTCEPATCNVGQNHFVCKDPKTNVIAPGCYTPGVDDCQKVCANKGNCVPVASCPQ